MPARSLSLSILGWRAPRVHRVRILGLSRLLPEVPGCMLNMSLHASRDRELSPSQCGLLHPGHLGVLGSSSSLTLALPSAPAGRPAPLRVRGAQGLKVSWPPRRGCLAEAAQV